MGSFVQNGVTHSQDLAFKVEIYYENFSQK